MTHKTQKRILTILISVSLFLSCNNAISQSRIAIVNLMDTALIHVNIGITVFSNSEDEFDGQFNPKDYVNSKMEQWLSKKFLVNFIDADGTRTDPATPNVPDDEIYNSVQDKKLNYKSWVKEHRDEYRYVIFVENRPWTEQIFNKTLYSNGLLTGANAINSWAKVYSTVYFTAYSTVTQKPLYYDKTMLVYTRNIENYQFPDEKRQLNTDMLPMVIEDLKRLIDSRTRYFLQSSGLLKQEELQ